MLEGFNNLVGVLNGPIWGIGMIILIFGSGLFFTIGLRGFQFARFRDMWSRILDKGDSESGISAFASFCTTMAMRVGTGNVAGVAVALYMGGPGAMFWMILAGMTNSAVCFVECTLSSLYKIRMDGEYRGGGPYVAERGLGWKWYGAFYAAFFGLGVIAFMPAAATNTICDGFRNALGIPMWITALVIALIMLVVVMGGVKRISAAASLLVPPMVVIYLVATVVILVVNIGQLPGVIATVVKCAFGSKEAFLGGGVGIAIQQGVKRGTFSSASGMGESMPPAAAAETSHPVKQGLANAAGVWLDTVVVCTASGLMMLLTGCYNTQFGYVGTGAPEMAELAAAGTNGVIFVQLGCRTIMGGIAPLFVAVMLALFSFTCLISYYYEGETSLLYLFQGEEKEQTRKVVRRIMQIGMPILIFIWGNVASGLAWNLSDLALGGATWINMLVMLILSPKAFALYKDYCEQMKAKKDPYYNPDKLCWKGVDADLWREINKKRIEADK